MRKRERNKETLKSRSMEAMKLPEYEFRDHFLFKLACPISIQPVLGIEDLNNCLLNEYRGEKSATEKRINELYRKVFHAASGLQFFFSLLKPEIYTQTHSILAVVDSHGPRPFIEIQRLQTFL